MAVKRLALPLAWLPRNPTHPGRKTTLGVRPSFVRYRGALTAFLGSWIELYLCVMMCSKVIIIIKKDWL